MEIKEENKEIVNQTPRWFTWVKRGVLGFFLLILLCLFLIQFSGVQTWMSSKFCNYLSDLTDTKVTADKVKFSIFDGVVLNHLAVVDAEGDTILSAGTINLSLRKNLFYIFKNKLDLSYIGVKNVNLIVNTKLGETSSKMDNFLSKLFAPSGSATSSKKIEIFLKEIELSKIDVKIHNENKGVIEEYGVASAIIDINYLDWECNDFDINEIILDAPKYSKIVYDYSCEVSKSNISTQNKNIEPAGQGDIAVSEPMVFTLRNLFIQNGNFGIENNLIKSDTIYKNSLDYNHFNFGDININFEKIRYSEEVGLTLGLKSLEATDNTGYKIKNLTCDSILITSSLISFPNYSLEFGKSKLSRKLSFSFLDFKSFSDFTNQVVINSTFEDSKLYKEDLSHFVKSINKNSFLVLRADEYVRINGKYFGKISNIAGRDVDIEIADKLAIKGSFNTRNLTDLDNAVLNIKIDKFNSSMKKLKMLIPSFSLPPNFNKLGSLSFSGRFDGYLEDFVAYGKLKTDLGIAELDMRLDIANGTTLANYSGNLNLQNFNLGRWSDNSDFGLVNFKSKVVNGKGLTLNTVKTDISATINSLFYKDYQYKDVTVDGVIDKNTFNGGFNISDPNIDINFDGSFEYLNNKAFLNFESKIKNVDLYALNIVSYPLDFSGDLVINTVGNNINDFTGALDVNQFRLKLKDSLYTLDHINLQSKITVNNDKKLSVESDLGSIEVEGEYDLLEVGRAFKKVIYNGYPFFAKSWKEDVLKLKKNQKITYNVNLTNSKNFMSLIGLNDSQFRKLTLKGILDTYKDDVSLAATLPLFKYKNDSLKNIQILITSNNQVGDVLVHIDTTHIIGKLLNPIDLHANLKGDTINFALATDNLINTFESFDIKGQLIPDDKGFRLTMENDLLVVLGKTWSIDARNRVIFGDHFIDIENLNISDGYRKITLNDINDNQGLSLDLDNFNLDLINDLIKYDKMSFEGESNASIRLTNLYDNTLGLTLNLKVPKFLINGDPYGAIYIDVAKDAASPTNVNINIGDFLAVSGSYDEKNKVVDSKIKLKEAPLFILQYILKDGITNTTGYLTGEGFFGGKLDDLSLDGNGVVYNGSTKIVYTGATYYFDNQKIKLTDKVVDLDGAKLTDQNGNVGTVTGGLYHNMFKGFGANATITGTNVVALNTTKADNPDYYGYGVGQVTAKFTGLFDLLNMEINAITGPGSKLFIPVGNSISSVNQSFIKFVKNEEIISESTKRNFVLKGINVEMSLTLTTDAEVSIIFDESKGDIIKGTGRGNMKIDITRQGVFEIFGDYEIEQGQYLFTVALLPVAKPFVVERGSTIRWTGDPINTSLDITANYRTRTSVKPFVEEYLSLSSPTTQRLAEQRTEVDLQLKLTGTLFKPIINFDLSFPNLTSDLASYTDSKLRLLRTNKLELNSQVLGLIVFKSFLPSNKVSDVFGAAGLQSAGLNTLSEFLSSQLSLYITNVLSSALEENGLISAIDFEVGLRNNTLGVANAGTNNIYPDEIEVRLQNKFRFMDERLSLNLGGNYVFQNQGLTVNQVLPDFALELILTDDRKLKVRLYGKGDLDPIYNTSLRQKYGLGVAYRTEFGSMLDFEKKLKSGLKNTVDQQLQ